MRRSESGFALLFVFAMAATLAVMFFLELPRIAFERQREKEQLLIERGEQYRRAIQLFVRKFNRYPGTLNELENTNNIRFLRRRYKDPMTGKAEWRLIHIGPGGVLLDSLVTKPPAVEPSKQESTELAQASTEGQALPAGPQAVVRRRPSEMPGAAPPPGVAEGMPGADQLGLQPPVEAQPAAPGQAYQYPVYLEPGSPPPAVVGTVPMQPGQPPPVVVGAVPLQPGQPPPVAPGVQMPWPGPTTAVEAGPAPPNAQGPVPQYPGQFPATPLPSAPQPGVARPPQAPPYPVQNVPGLPAPYGAPGTPSVGTITITPGSLQPAMSPGQQGPQIAPSPAYSTQPGSGGAPTPGYSPFRQPGLQPLATGQDQNPAIQLIRELLTKPRPGGAPGYRPPQAGAQQPQGNLIATGGIAGVASTLEAEAIMVYNDRTKYNEWEFVYDFRKDPVKMGQLARPATATPQAEPQRTVFPKGSGRR